MRELTEALPLKDTGGRLPTHQIPSPLDPGQILPCGGLVEVSRSGDPEHVGGWTVRLAHSSTKEHLTADRFREERVEIRELADSIFGYHMNHGLLAKTCLSYLIIQDVKCGAGSVDRHSPSQWPPPAASTIHQDPTLSSYGLRSYAIQNGPRTSLQIATTVKSATHTPGTCWYPPESSKGRYFQTSVSLSQPPPHSLSPLIPRQSRHQRRSAPT